MDAQKSMKIAARRFQNGNYLLSLKKYGQARTEFEVALTLYEKTESYKELAEALNNIGLTLLKDGQADAARATLSGPTRPRSPTRTRPGNPCSTRSTT